jgi:hypothetical protein
MADKAINKQSQFFTQHIPSIGEPTRQPVQQQAIVDEIMRHDIGYTRRELLFCGEKKTSLNWKSSIVL